MRYINEETIPELLNFPPDERKKICKELFYEALTQDKDFFFFHVVGPLLVVVFGFPLIFEDILGIFSTPRPTFFLQLVVFFSYLHFMLGHQLSAKAREILLQRIQDRAPSQQDSSNS